MVVKTTTVHICDVCKAEGARQYTMSVLFLTEQTEGRGVPPYFSVEKVDLCAECESWSIAKREMLTASGAQGHNTYWFHSKGRP